MESLNQFLMANRHRVCTLIIDDAQNLNKRGQIELLRLVQNLETQQHKLLNLVFFAQLEWMDVLRAAPNFEQRINLTYMLEPMGFDEFCHLVEFRIIQAGAGAGQGPDFESIALRAIHAYAEGNPRVIVTLCRNVLLAAAQLRSRSISPDLVALTIEKTTLPDAAKRAKVAAAISQARQQSTQSGAPRSNGAEKGQVSREQRAAQMLLRSSRVSQ